MKRFFVFLGIFMGAMVSARAAKQDVKTPDIGKIELFSIELVRALNNPDIMPYDRFDAGEKLLKVNFRSSVDLLDFAQVQGRMIAHESNLCEKTMHYKPTQSLYATILDNSELYQSGIDLRRQTEAFILEKSPDPQERKDADLNFEYNKKRTQIYYFYILPHSRVPVNTLSLSIPTEDRTDNDYDLEKTPADVCFRLESDRLMSGVPVKPTLYSNTIRIPKDTIAEALKHN